jgi:hypothetical protein
LLNLTFESKTFFDSQGRRTHVVTHIQENTALALPGFCDILRP